MDVSSYKILTKGFYFLGNYVGGNRLRAGLVWWWRHILVNLEFDIHSVLTDLGNPLTFYRLLSLISSIMYIVKPVQIRAKVRSCDLASLWLTWITWPASAGTFFFFFNSGAILQVYYIHVLISCVLFLMFVFLIKHCNPYKIALLSHNFVTMTVFKVDDRTSLVNLWRYNILLENNSRGRDNFHLHVCSTHRWGSRYKKKNLMIRRRLACPSAKRKWPLLTRML